jgi:hypothetical protein
MFPAVTKQGGLCFGFPDTCYTPAPPAPNPVPLPYPNFAQPNQARIDTVSMKVKICGKNVLTRKSVIMISSGDEPGNAPGGVISGVFKGQAVFRRASIKVKAEGNPVVFLTCQTAQNGNNANVPVGNTIAPSQFKVFIGS